MKQATALSSIFLALLYLLNPKNALSVGDARPASYSSEYTLGLNEKQKSLGYIKEDTEALENTFKRAEKKEKGKK